MSFIRSGFAALTVLLFINTVSNEANASDLHSAERFLNSIQSRVGVEAPRLHKVGAKTSVALPSYLQQWGITGADAAAAYNDWLNTLVLQPEMTITDGTTGKFRIRTLLEIHQITGSASSTAASTIFHELSHAEWDLFVEEGHSQVDKDLLESMDSLLPSLTAGFLERRILPSEIFAYYRGDLIGMILSDANEILLASGLEPDSLNCITRRHPADSIRNYSPSNVPYAQRHSLTVAWVQGNEINLTSGIDPEAKKLNTALFNHAQATMKFPKSRAELLKLLQSKPNLRKKIIECAAIAAVPGA